jgi:hypothetical protein
VRRRLLNLLTALSLLVCVAVVVLWVRSYWAGDYVRWQAATAGGMQGERSVAVASVGGRIHLRDVRVHLPAFTADELAEFAQHAGSGTLPVGFQWGFGVGWQVPAGVLGFHLERTDERLRYRFAGGRQEGRRRELNLTVPHWLIVALLGAMPAWRAVTSRRRRVAAERLRLGQCRRCGYDLRATPDRCPECGKEREPL